MKKYRFHPICLLFPQMSREELQQLADDIKENGLLNDIVLYQGKVLDGRNRQIACGMAGVLPRYVEWDGDGSPLQWVISENMVRRHLTSSQRAVLALELLPLLEQEADVRQTLGKKLSKVPPNGKGKASQVAARLVHSNPVYVQAVKNIRQQAPELLEEVRNGILRVPDAAKLARLSRVERRGVLRLCNGHPVSGTELRDILRQAKTDVRQRAARAFARTSKSAFDQNIVIGDMDVLHDRLEDDSTDLFMTDPPYADVESYERLAELAAAKLKPGGLCLAYAGQFHLSEIMEAMGRHLRYWWMIAVEFGGQHCAVHPRRIQNKWKPIIAYAKPPLKKAPELAVGPSRRWRAGQATSRLGTGPERSGIPDRETHGAGTARSGPVLRWRHDPYGVQDPRQEVVGDRDRQGDGVGGAEEAGGNGAEEAGGVRRKPPCDPENQRHLPHGGDRGTQA